MSNNDIVRYIVQGNSTTLRGTSCQELRANGPWFADKMGYTSEGISKYSLAAQGMSIEAIANGGGVPPMREGGITASLQSIGACGYIKPAAEAAIQDGLVRGGIKRNGRLC